MGNGNDVFGNLDSLVMLSKYTWQDNALSLSRVEEGIEKKDT